MKSIDIVRRIDELGRIIIPKEIRRTLNITDGCPLVVSVTKSGGIFLCPYKASFEELVHDWYQSHPYEMSHTKFARLHDRTLCITSNGRHGVAKRYKDDVDDTVIGKVAAYANAMGTHINDLIGWKG